MNMRYILPLLLFFISINSYAYDEINVNNTVLNIPYPNKFTGMSIKAAYEYIDTVYDANTNKYTSKIFNEIYKYIQPLNTKVYRFPGGTLGNYYHFYGRGHGIDTSETTCAPGRVGNIDYANMQLGFDAKADKNDIDYVIEELDTLKKTTDGIGVCFRINSHTHFYKGDLKKYSTTIQQLIYTYFASDTSILSTNGNTLDSNKINSIVLKLLQLQNDNLYKNIKTALVNDTGFYKRFKENLDAVDFLLKSGTRILGAEIGNETYAEYVVFDDDFKYLGFDCTQAPTNFHFNLLDLPLKYYLQGLLKNNLLVSLYADSLKQKYSIYSAVPAAGGYNYLTLNTNYEPVHLKPYDLGVKKSDLWNKYYASQQNVYALIPHIYSQDFLSCNNFMNSDSLYNISRNKIPKIAERFYKYFIDTLLIYNLQRLNYYANNKPLWITEWNFSDNSFANNTFLHAFYNYYFIRKMLDVHEYSPNYVQVLIYHHLIGASNNWPVIRAVVSGHNFYAEKQITYYPFYIWSNTINKQVKKLKTPFLQNIQNTIIDAFIDSNKKSTIIQFVNTDSIMHFIDMKNIKITDNNKTLIIEKVNRFLLDADNLLSTNYSTCPFYNNPLFNTQYTTTEDTLATTDTLWMPAYSMGKFTLQLKEQINNNVFYNLKKNTFQLYPNPSKTYITLQSNSTLGLQNIRYCIYDALGNQIEEGKINSIKQSLNIENYAKGWYSIKIEDNGQLIDNLSFIKS